jgi:nitroreductase
MVRHCNNSGHSSGSLHASHESKAGVVTCSPNNAGTEKGRIQVVNNSISSGSHSQLTHPDIYEIMKGFGYFGQSDEEGDMDVIEAVSGRYSVRSFKRDAIPKETIMKILEPATRSPSGGNTQPWEMFVASEATMERIRSAYVERFRQGVQWEAEMEGATTPDRLPASFLERFSQLQAERAQLLGLDPQDQAMRRTNMEESARFYDAPVLVVLCMDRSVHLSAVFSVGMLAQTICLVAFNSGIGSLIAGNFVGYPDLLHRELQIPEDLMIVIGIGLGYPNEKSAINTFRSSRRPISEVVRYRE